MEGLIWNLLIAIFSVVLGSVLIPLVFRYYLSRARLNRLIMELISNRVALDRYKGKGIYVVEEVAWQAAREDETIINLLINTRSPNVLHKLTNSYQFAKSRSETKNEKESNECRMRFQDALDALEDYMKQRSPRMLGIPLYSHRRFVRLTKSFRR